MKIVHQKDFAAGLLYIAVGAAFAIGALQYRMGTASRMGPAYFPFWLGVLMAIIGLAVLVGSMRRSAEGDDLEGWGLKPLLIVLLSVIVFGLLLNELGLVVALIAMVIISSLASPEFTWKATLLNTLVLIAIALIVFVYGLGLNFPVLPMFLTT